MAAQRLETVLETVNRGFLLNGVTQSSQVLGCGTFGTVYLGHWCYGKVAIKRLHPTMLRSAGGEQTLDAGRFIKEINLHRLLSHPHIAQILGVVEATDRLESHGIVFELLEKSLRDRYDVYPRLNDDQETEIARGVSSGLCYMHSVSVLHRDLTTGNIMLNERPDGLYHAKITDMGVSSQCPLELIVRRLSRAPGTLSYMAPEAQGYDDPHQPAFYGSRSDCFSFGIAMLAMLVRREPPTPQMVLKHGRHDLDALQPDNKLHDVIKLCLNDCQQDRPPAEAICERLKPDPCFTTPQSSPVFLEALRMTPVESPTKSMATAALPVPAHGHVHVPPYPGYGVCLEDTRMFVREQEWSGAGLFPYRPAGVAVVAAAADHSRNCSPDCLPVKPAVLTEVDAEHQSNNELGVLSRCLKVLNARHMEPLPQCPPKWRQLAKMPKHAKNRCPQPCVHNGYLYCAFQRHDAASEARLYRLRTADVGGEQGWVRCPMPPWGTWHWMCYLISSPLGLVCVCMGEQSGGFYTVMLIPDHGEWREVRRLPEAKYSFGVAIYGAELIVAGGRSGPRRMDAQLDTVHSLDLCAATATAGAQAEWQRWAHPLHTCSKSSLVVHRGRLHAIGRCEVQRPDARRVMSADLGRPLAERCWSRDVLGDVPVRSCGVVAVCHQHLVVCGGQAEPFLVSGESKGTPVANNVYMCVDSDDSACERKWLPLPRLVTPQRLPAVVADDRRLICFGGKSEMDSTSMYVEVLEM